MSLNLPPNAFVPFLVAGDPSPEATMQAMLGLADGGADLIELGLPFSDPLADGPVIQAAATRALAGGMTVSGALELAKKFRAQRGVPLIFFTYYNPILRRGLERFAREAAAAGAQGVLVPDLPVEEAGPLQAALNAHGLVRVDLIAPTSTPERRQSIARGAQGFIYLVSTTGVTGERRQLEASLAAQIQETKALTALPVLVGFGISEPGQAAGVVALGADGAVVGSALVRRLPEWADPYTGARDWAAGFRQALGKKAEG